MFTEFCVWEPSCTLLLFLFREHRHLKQRGAISRLSVFQMNFALILEYKSDSPFNLCRISWFLGQSKTSSPALRYLTCLPLSLFLHSEHSWVFLQSRLRAGIGCCSMLSVYLRGLFVSALSFVCLSTCHLNVRESFKPRHELPSLQLVIQGNVTCCVYAQKETTVLKLFLDRNFGSNWAKISWLLQSSFDIDIYLGDVRARCIWLSWRSLLLGYGSYALVLLGWGSDIPSS